MIHTYDTSEKYCFHEIITLILKFIMYLLLVYLYMRKQYVLSDSCRQPYLNGYTCIEIIIVLYYLLITKMSIFIRYASAIYFCQGDERLWTHRTFTVYGLPAE